MTHGQSARYTNTGGDFLQIGPVFHQNTLLRDGRRTETNKISQVVRIWQGRQFTEFQVFSFSYHILPCRHWQLTSIPSVTDYIVEQIS